MQKIKLIALFVAAIIIVNIALLFPPAGFAQATATDSSTMATDAAKVNYTLAYPGILPDNPLYVLKAARDKLVSFLISDNQKKADFNLLTSDKRISASMMLAAKGKTKLALDSLSKSNNYLNKAIGDMAAAKKEGREVDSSLSNISNSIKKHMEIAIGIKNKIGKKYEKAVTLEEKRLVKMQKTVTQLIQK